MSTARDLIRGAMRLIGAIAAGETPSADEQIDALNSLNDMLDSWSNEGLTIFAHAMETFPLVPGQATYTMGPTANFDTPKAQKVEIASIITSDTTPNEIPLTMLNQDDWAAVSVKNTQGTLPTKLYIDSGYPFDTLYVWPIPSAPSSIKLYSWKPLGTFANANAVVTLPPGWKKALKYGLALELAPEYGKEPSALVVEQYDLAKENIKRMNVRSRQLEMDPALQNGPRGFNYLTGE